MPDEIIQRHTGGQMTNAFQSFRVQTPREAVIQGTAGWIKLHESWWGTSRLTVKTGAADPETLNFSLRGGGYTHMAEAFMDLIRAGKRDSDVMPLAESLTIMETMDSQREQWGQKYPME